MNNLLSNLHQANASHACHLTDDQLADLLTATSSAQARCETTAGAHLLACELCAAELDGLRESISLFKEASVACASTVLADRTAGQPRQWVVPAQRPYLVYPAVWVAAAAMLLTAVLLPMQLRRPAAATSVASHTTVSSGESDEALLEDVNRDISASVPSPMQALVDPTGGEDSALLQMPVQTSDPIAIVPPSTALTPVLTPNQGKD
jgi:hypothetical protein